jgi:hypothetical protein
MTSILKTLFVAVILAAGATTAFSAELTYHWGYPDSFKGQPNLPVQSFSGGSGIPPLYR